MNNICGGERGIKMKNNILLLFAGLMILPLTSCGSGKKAEEPEPHTRVKMSAVSRGSIEETLSLTGDIHGEKEVKVFSKVTGKLIEKRKREGDRVRAKEVIALIDRDETALDFSRAEVVSPIKGILTMFYPDLGDAVFPAPGEPVAVVADMDRVKITVYLSAEDSVKVREGQKARAYTDAYPGRRFEGTVTLVAPAANPLTRKIKAEVTVPNAGHLLKPGTFARVEIVTGRRAGILTLPKKALRSEEDKQFVSVVKDGRAHSKQVLTGISDEDLIEIRDGLTEGEAVILEGNYGLADGTKVIVIEK
ncbi:MAG: hypothetical protein COS41_06300 [Elusimicrobia bacterium CG03_land_8_20_14_0_80_50_18]|nr:MAG: hypothetical protein COS41_06300 [Elusimicrobia bacterium CG03_land_8_20_14_0_80_50_18]PIX14061.1 MAG: hypothetical protein COZ72_06905 [Elusimicrobia bacterium CG_4_8_14_3_um_filter_50_9]